MSPLICRISDVQQAVCDISYFALLATAFHAQICFLHLIFSPSYDLNPCCFTSVSSCTRNSEIGTIIQHFLLSVHPQVWRTRCAVSARKIGGHAPLILTRWYADQPPLPYNLVLMQRPYALLLEKGGHAALPQDCIARIEERLKWAEEVCRGAWIGSNKNSSIVSTPVPPIAATPAAESAHKQNRVDEHRQYQLRMLAIPAMAIFCYVYVSITNNKYNIDIDQNRIIVQEIRQECQKKIREAVQLSDKIIRENQSRTFR